MRWQCDKCGRFNTHDIDCKRNGKGTVAIGAKGKIFFRRKYDNHVERGLILKYWRELFIEPYEITITPNIPIIISHR